MTDDEQADAPTEQSQSESPVASLPMPRRFACGAHGRAENGSGAFHHGETSPTTDPSLEARGDAGTSQSARRGPALRLTFSTGPEITVLPRVLEDLLVCLLYTSDAADDLPRVDLGGRRFIKKKHTTRPEQNLDTRRHVQH